MAFVTAWPSGARTQLDSAAVSPQSLACIRTSTLRHRTVSRSLISMAAPSTPGAGNSSNGNSDDSSSSSSSEPQFDAKQLEVARSALEHTFSTVELQGEGRTTCLWCSGSGRCRCPWCRGEGHRLELEMKSAEALKEDIDRMMKGEPVEPPGKIPVRCSACNGSKTLPCRYCRGSGVGFYGFSAGKP